MKKTLLLTLVIFVFAANAAVSDTVKPLAAYKIDSLWYIVDHGGKALLNPQKLLFVGGYSEGFFRIYFELEGYKFWAFMNSKGEIAVPQCDEIRRFKEGMAMILDVVDEESGLNLYGFINKEGKMIVPKKYLDATDFSEGLAWVMNREERGYIDTAGKFVIKWENEGFGSAFSEGLAAMTNENDRFGFINKKGEVVINYDYDEVTSFVNGLARVNILAKWGFIDTLGVLKIKPEFDFALDFVEGFCFVGIPDPEKLTPMWGIINRGGGKVTDFIYEEVRDFSDGIGVVKQDGKWSYIDYFGNKIIAKEFVNANSFRNSLAWADDGKTSGFINPSGEFEVIFPPEAEVVIDLRFNKKVK